jgi:hypothetical protein
MTARRNSGRVPRMGPRPSPAARGVKWITCAGMAVVLLLAGAGQARAGAIQLTNPNQLDPKDTTAIYPQAEGDLVPSPYMQAAGGNTLTFKTAGNTPFLRLDQGSGWNGDFPAGTKLLYTNGPFGPVDISFATGVGEMGVLAQSNIPATHTFTITAFNGAASLLTWTVPGDGFASFIGVRATGSDVLTRIHIAGDDEDFALGPVTFGSPAAVPEPSTLALSALGACGLLAHRWRRRKPVAA